jgi:uncharacterized protein YbjQ (UPF0145 family)
MIEIIVLLSLLALGYGFGSYREKAHFESIREREAELADIMLFESRFPPDAARGRGGELVKGNVVISADYFKIFVAGLRKLVGGRLRSYETLLDRGRREAVLRMKLEARVLGAEQIFNIRYETSSISKGAENTLGSIEVLVYGTALRKA